jgi:hypothetical protein
MSGLGLWKVAGVCHRATMSGRLVPMRVGDVELLVETVAVAGSEPTTRLGDAGAQVVEAYERAQDAIVALGGSVADTVRRLTQQAARPEQVRVEFGLRFTAAGSVFVASAAGEASLRVTMTYPAGGGAPA